MSYRCRPCAPLYSSETTALAPNRRSIATPQNCVWATWISWATLRGLTGGKTQGLGSVGQVAPANRPRLLTETGATPPVICTRALFGGFWIVLKLTLPELRS